MWSGIWCWASGNARSIYATVVDYSICDVLLSITPLHICHANPKTPWTRRWHCRACWKVLHTDNPSNVFTCYQLSNPKVLASTEQSQSSGMAWFCGFHFPHWNPATLPQSVSLGYYWCCSRLWHLGMGHRFESVVLCSFLVQRWVEGIVMVSLQGYLGLCETLCWLSCDALPRDLVFHVHNCSHWTPRESYHCSWLPFNLVRLQLLKLTFSWNCS